MLQSRHADCVVQRYRTGVTSEVSGDWSLAPGCNLVWWKSSGKLLPSAHHFPCLYMRIRVLIPAVKHLKNCEGKVLCKNSVLLLQERGQLFALTGTQSLSLC